MGADAVAAERLQRAATSRLSLWHRFGVGAIVPRTHPESQRMENSYFSRQSARKLVELGKRFVKTVPPPKAGRWRQRSSGQLWVDVLRQLAVAGGADGGTRLACRLKGREDKWYEELGQLQKGRESRIRSELVGAGVRFVPKQGGASAKLKAAVENFQALDRAGGPVAFFSQLPHGEADRIRYVRSNLQYVKHKGARDLLIGLGAVKNAIALDVRWKNILQGAGVAVPRNFQTSRSTYEQLEREILEKVCKPLGVTGAHLDRAFFKDENYEQILALLGVAPRARMARGSCSPARKAPCAP
jgi:hypothetical protein